MKVIQIEIPEHGKCVIKVAPYMDNDPVEIVAEEIRQMIEGGSSGDKLIVELLEMSSDEYNKLPEWEGW